MWNMLLLPSNTITNGLLCAITQKIAIKHQNIEGNRMFLFQRTNNLIALISMSEVISVYNKEFVFLYLHMQSYACECH